jgi:hypothetical protein
MTDPSLLKPDLGRFGVWADSQAFVESLRRR